MKAYGVWYGSVLPTDKNAEWLTISSDKKICEKYADWLNTGTAGGYEVLEVMVIPVKGKKGKKQCLLR